mmetsp:Transcript_110000/g.179491  ORF Transcript_110000/g.179491 Transcript_110000/m.179491 type:complete len:543 (+) Transcript_110000:63-1691(+)
MHLRLPSFLITAAAAGTLLLQCLACSDSDTCEDQSLHGVPETSWCLVQSKRSISTVSPGLVQSARGGSSSNAGQPPRRRDPSTDQQQGFTQGPLHFSALSQYAWARFAHFISEQWRVIVAMFTVTFALLFPGFHWAFEKREDERNMFAATFDQQGSPSSAIEDSGYSNNEPGEGILKLLEHIRVDDQGGLDNCRKLMPDSGGRKWRRYGMLVLKISAVVFNLTMMCVMDREMLLGAMQFYNGKEESDLPDTLRKYLRLTANVSLISVRHAACVAIAELIGLSAMVTWITYRFMVFWIFRRSPDVRLKFDAFLGAFEVFDGITLLGSFSALRLVSLSHPHLILARFSFHMATYASAGGHLNQAFQATWFIATRMAVVFIGIIAFGVKLAFASVSMHSPMGSNGPWMVELLWRWSVVVITLIQTLGAVSVERVLWNRVMFFIIAGGDGQITLPKVQTAHVYLSRLVQAIYEEFCGNGEVMKFFIVMMTFDHADLQFMLLDEDEGGADELVRKATMYFERTHAPVEGIDSSESPVTFRPGRRVNE